LPRWRGEPRTAAATLPLGRPETFTPIGACGTSIPLRSGHWHDDSGSYRSVPIPKRRPSSARPIIFACGEQELRTRNDGSIVILIVVVFVLLVVILVLVLVQVMLELAP
jgi:hypothetical protein